jgi:diaminohydroxyphosphoribosylaminopyrimidine deaminase/5-amino-6-(5-phosphoribosylamino)uracil reductase
MIATTEHMPQTKRAALQALGCEVLVLSGHHDRVSVVDLLVELGRRRFTNILVEGGSGVFGAFFDASEIDEFHVFISHRFIGSAAAMTPIGGVGAQQMADARRLTNWTNEVLDGDLYIHGWR